MRYLLLLLAFFCCVFNTALASEKTLDMGAFSNLPVLHEGRLKPLKSFARLYLLQFSGTEKINGQSPTDWLAQTLFDPATAAQKPIFEIRNPDLKTKMGLSHDQNYFSLSALQPGLQQTAPLLEDLLKTDAGKLTTEQLDLLHIHENALAFMQLLRGVSLILPLDVEIPPKYKITENTYAGLLKIEPKLMADLKKIIKRKGEEPEKYNEEEKQIAQLAFQLQMFGLTSGNNILLRIIPASSDEDPHLWVSPWAMINEGKGSPYIAEYLSLLKDMASAYRAEDKDLWNKSTYAALNTIKNEIPLGTFKLENAYNDLKPFHWALGLYAAALLTGLILLFKPAFKPLAIIALSLGTLAHGLGMIIRMIVLNRPPVGTLYESILFVSFIVAAIALFMTIRSKNTTAIFAGAFTSMLLLIIAPFMLQQGESMEMLVAVLNTNFWLATHVLCITAGYGVCIISGVFAHIYLGLRLWKPEPAKLGKLHALIYRTSLVALLLTCVGTVLGGIWADQSWGRFWGWDPKENGALLIVLWLIWTLHGRVSGHLPPILFAASLAYLNVIVALAWFGVNLLNVGLHSYGFVSGIAEALAAFCTFETLLIAAACFMIFKKEKGIHAY